MPYRAEDVWTDIGGEEVHAFRELTLAIEALRQAVAEHLGVGVTDAIALSYLAADGPLTPGDLAEAMRLAPSSITAVVDRLAAAGAVGRSPVQGDRRQVTVTITPRGQQWLQWSSSQVRDILAAADLPDRDAFIEGMGALTTALRTQIGQIQADVATVH